MIKTDHTLSSIEENTKLYTNSSFCPFPAESGASMITVATAVLMSYGTDLPSQPRRAGGWHWPKHVLIASHSNIFHPANKEWNIVH